MKKKRFLVIISIVAVVIVAVTLVMNVMGVSVFGLLRSEERR